MSTKTSLSAALLLSMLVLGTVRAADPPAPLPVTEPGKASQAGNSGTPLASDSYQAPGTLSNWITYTHPNCCGPVGGDGPILTELYLRTGLSLPVSGGTIGHTIGAGWEIQGGGRSLFFNPEMNSAWTVDLSLGNIYNNGNRTNLTYPFRGLTVSTQSLNRTFVTAGLGKEWYPLMPADNSAGVNWRAGFDGGGRLGVASLALNGAPALPATGFRRTTDVLSGLYVALHTDAEYPCGLATFLGGFRVEWDYTWMDPNGGPTGDVEDVNFLLTGGLRF